MQVFNINANQLRDNFSYHTFFMNTNYAIIHARKLHYKVAGKLYFSEFSSYIPTETKVITLNVDSFLHEINWHNFISSRNIAKILSYLCFSRKITQI